MRDKLSETALFELMREFEIAGARLVGHVRFSEFHDLESFLNFRDSWRDQICDNHYQSLSDKKSIKNPSETSAPSHFQKLPAHSTIIISNHLINMLLLQHRITAQLLLQQCRFAVSKRASMTVDRTGRVPQNDAGTAHGRLSHASALLSVHVSDVVGVLLFKLVRRDLLRELVAHHRHRFIERQADSLEKQSVLTTGAVLEVVVEPEVPMHLLHARRERSDDELVDHVAGDDGTVVGVARVLFSIVGVIGEEFETRKKAALFFENCQVFE